MFKTQDIIKSVWMNGNGEHNVLMDYVLTDVKSTSW